ncbi:MAG: 30S ribosomal protein S20 [Dehalococcoidia bacterium]
MPAKKTARVQERRRIINRRVRSSSRTAVKKAVNLLHVSDPEAGTAVVKAVSALDRAAQKGIIHPNNAARRKSRLIKRQNAATAN